MHGYYALTYLEWQSRLSERLAYSQYADYGRRAEQQIMRQIDIEVRDEKTGIKPKSYKDTPNFKSIEAIVTSVTGKAYHFTYQYFHEEEFEDVADIKEVPCYEIPELEVSLDYLERGNSLGTNNASGGSLVVPYM